MSEPRSYYGRPVIKAPVWTPEIPVYFFAGGLAGGSAALGFAAGVAGNEVLARRAWAASLAGIGVSPALLISDLGRPARFLNMLRMFKVTSPMSVGSWILSGAGAAIAPAALHAWTGGLPGVARVARPVAAVLGLPLATYTGALIANTAVPVWHEARQTLPFLFGAGAAASAGAAAVALTPVAHAGAARRLAVGAAAAELVVAQAMEQSLGDLGEPYHEGAAGRASRVASILTAAGAATVALGARRSRAAAVLGGGAILAGAMAERWSVYKAGFQSAADPKYTVGPQRARADAGRGHGASRGTAVAGGAGVSPAADVEIERALNAIAATLNDQRPADPHVLRLQEIVDGSCGGERRLRVRVLAPSRFAVDDAETHHHVGTVEHEGSGRWSVWREGAADGSPAGLPGGG